MDTSKFIWEPECHEGFKEIVEKEIFIDKVYEKYFEVEEGDVVFDVGASLGPFTYSILDKNPSQVFAFEPSFEEFKTRQRVRQLRGIIELEDAQQLAADVRDVLRLHVEQRFGGELEVLHE